MKAGRTSKLSTRASTSARDTEASISKVQVWLTASSVTVIPPGSGLAYSKVPVGVPLSLSASSTTMELTKEQAADLQVKRSTTTPLWKGFLTMVQYRTKKNYVNPEFLGPRVADKLIFALLIATLYLGIGDDLEPSNYLNIAAVLFMWTTLPACAAQPLLLSALL